VGAQVDYRTDYLEPPAVDTNARVVRLDVDSAALRQGIEPALAIQADPRSGLTDLAAELARRGAPPFADWAAEARRRYLAFRRRWDEPAPAAPATGRHLVDALRPLLDAETLFLVDGGNIGQWVHMVLGNRYPENWLTCGASGVVGWGLGGAIATKLAFPDRPVVLLSGDGSFGFTIAELETAVRHNAAFVAVVADDRYWGIVASGQRRAYGEEGVLGCRLGPVAYDRLAEDFGALGLRAERPEDVLPLVRRGLESGRPTVVHVPINPGGPAD
jgi:acetolactate synthase I/II/III large subunit